MVRAHVEALRHDTTPGRASTPRINLVLYYGVLVMALDTRGYGVAIKDGKTFSRSEAPVSPVHRR
jgi:hypothetical protein